jgi:hypothetical protein
MAWRWCGGGEFRAIEGQGLVEPLLLGAEDLRGAPETLADIAAELAGQQRQHPGAKPIPRMLRRGVRSVLAVPQLFARGIGFDFGAPDPEPRSEDLQRDAVNLADRPGPHASEAGTASAKEIE